MRDVPEHKFITQQAMRRTKKFNQIFYGWLRIMIYCVAGDPEKKFMRCFESH